MPPARSTRKTKSVAKEASAPSEKTITRASRRKALTLKTDDVSLLMEEELPTTPALPKRQGQKPKHVAAEVDNLPIQNVAEVPGTKTTDKPTGDTHIGSNVKSKKKAPVPTCDPLPAREGRNTHPGVHFGLQPTPRRSSQQVAAERKQKQQELEAQVQAAEVVKQQLALMDLEDKRYEEGFEEEGHWGLQFRKNDEDSLDGDKEFEGLDEVDSNEEDSPSPEPGKEVHTVKAHCNQLLTIKIGQK
jgi:hypothetical protein